MIFAIPIVSISDISPFFELIDEEKDFINDED